MFSLNESNPIRIAAVQIKRWNRVNLSDIAVAFSVYFIITPEIRAAERKSRQIYISRFEDLRRKKTIIK